MNIKQKENDFKNFLSSQRFTNSTYGILMVFRQNIDRMINLIEFHKIFLNRIESGDVKHTFPDEELTKIKHLVLMDALSKIMILIESLLNLLNCFSRLSYKDIPQRMVRYQPEQTDSFIKRFQESKVSIWKIAGFPRLKFLRNNCGLTKKETEFLDGILRDSCESIRITLNDIIDFYQANRILYGKFKHGLLFMPGFNFQQKNSKVPDSFLIAFDRLRDKPAKICFEGRQTSPIGLEWFNTYSILPYWDHTFEGYSDILSEIERLSKYIITNHLLYAFNCGEDYLPVKISPNGEIIVEVYAIKELSEQEKQKFEEVAQKVMKNIYRPNFKLDVKFNFSDTKLQKLLKCFQENHSAIIWKVLN